ncbi:MAG: hypothetical protein A2Z20_01560 [Bdellovibrionales bacterium RBG_16_40_8]|nr:MAG: hypothetical protein A2Z20_01560 [Bdellovibrionales bacterium RBG_16_40_8]
MSRSKKQLGQQIAYTAFAIQNKNDFKKEKYMTYHKFKIFVSSLAFLSLASCANTPHKVADLDKPRTSFTEEEDGRQVTNAAAKEVNAHNFVEIDFKQASAVLTKNAASSLESAVLQAKQRGEINQIIVLSWSDEEYPSKKLNKLSKVQSALAEKRNVAVKKYFASMKSVDVDTYNMAERPNALSKWFNTPDTKLKNALMAAGLPTTGDDLQYPSKASHSVILIKVD